MNLVYEPLLAWPGALRPHRLASPFSAKWDATLSLLDREAYALDAQRVTLRLAYPPHAFRLDGSLRGDRARQDPAHPGVVLVLSTRKHGDLTYSTDRFWRWRDNVRAVALGLESLRRIDRYGIADEGQQYAGWKQIGTGLAIGAPTPLTLAEAAALLADAHGAAGVIAADVLADLDTARACHRKAVRLLHPDHGGSGDGAKMGRLAEAWALVQAHHAVIA